MRSRPTIALAIVTVTKNAIGGTNRPMIRSPSVRSQATASALLARLASA